MTSELLDRALRSPHAHLIFEDLRGNLRDLAVTNLHYPDELGVGKSWYPRSQRTLRWDDQIAATNDVAILAYLASIEKPIPAFPAAGDRPVRFLDPSTLTAGLINAGGPAPGLNVVNDSITKRLFELAFDGPPPTLLGYRRGFQGLPDARASRPGARVRLVPSRSLVPQPGDPNYVVTDDYSSRPVTFLKSSRFDLRENAAAVAKAIQEEELDVLFICGGDGTFKGALAIKAELRKLGYRRSNGKELAVICGPKTMDWDLQFTDTTFGFTTTVDYLVDAIRTFHETVECQDRLGLMQVFGAASGFVALYASYCSGEVDYVILPEEVEREGVNRLFPGSAAQIIASARFVGLRRALEDAGFGERLGDVYQEGFEVCLNNCIQRVRERLRKKEHALVVIAEGAPARFEQSSAGDPWPTVVNRFKSELPDVKVTDIEPRYLIRDNAPRAYDTALCKIIGKSMVDAALAGYTDCMVSRWCGRHVLVPLQLAVANTSQVDPDDYFYRSMVGRYQIK